MKNHILYLVQQWNDQTSIWEISGIFSEKEKAISACRDESYVIGQFELDKQLPHESVDGVWYDFEGHLIENGGI